MASIEKRGDNYQITVSCGYASDGRKIRKKMTWTPEPGMSDRKVQRELQRQAILFEERVQSGEVYDGSMKLSDFIPVWFQQHVAQNLAPKTQQEYKKIWIRLEPAIGHLRLEKVSPIHLQTLYQNLSEDKMNLKTGGKLTGNSIMHFHRFLSSALTYAVRMNMIRDNPARRTQPPKVKTKEAAFLSEEEAANMINALTGEDIQFRTMLTLLLYGGMRKGELHGLKWTDLDFETGVLRIERELQYLQKNGLHVRPPKNESSIRWIKLSAGVLEVLRQYRTWQIEERLKVGDQWNDEDWIFTSWNGKPRHPDGLPKLLKAFLKKHGFRSNISLHSFRHSNASFLIAAGVDLRTVSKRLGHAQMSTTANIYSHQIRSADEAAAVALDLIIGGSSPQIVPQVSR